MTAATGSPVLPSQEYLAAVEQQLTDLPAEDRSALLEDLALHLEALGAEDDDRPLAVRLGFPADYAADLRAAAGLPARPGMPVSGPVRLQDRLARLSVGPAIREIWRLLGELRPAWWVLRGYLVVLVPCLVERDGVSDVPVPAPLDSHVLGVVLVVAAIAGSVALGRRKLQRPVAVLVGALGVGLVLFSFVLGQSGEISRASAGGVPLSATDEALGAYPLVSRHGPVTDVFPYAADGTPLEGVLLYDQDGRPLQVGFQEWWADGCVRVLEQPRAVDRVAVPNSFPQAYELPEQGLDVFGNPMTPGSCVENLPRPDVPLPTFPAQSAAPAPGD
jgi:hypothetical protein